MRLKDNFIVCEDEATKDKLLKKGFKLLNERKTKTGKRVFTFVNKEEISSNFSKEDNLNLEYTNKMFF